VPRREYTSAEFLAGKVPGFGKRKSRTASAYKALITARAEYRPGCITLALPVVLVNELNDHESKDWHPRHARSVKQAETLRTVILMLPPAVRLKCPAKMPLTVTFTRVSPGKLDKGDGNNSSFKWVRDALAKWVGVNDGDDRYEWVYLRRVERGKYGCEIRMEWDAEGGLNV